MYVCIYVIHVVQQKRHREAKEWERESTVPKKNGKRKKQHHTASARCGKIENKRVVENFWSTLQHPTAHCRYSLQRVPSRRQHCTYLHTNKHSQIYIHTYRLVCAKSVSRVVGVVGVPVSHRQRTIDATATATTTTTTITTTTRRTTARRRTCCWSQRKWQTL